MQDIDFDELDRAVASVGTSARVEEPDASSDTSIAVKTTPRSASTDSVPSRPSTGRFMDVVHPSSDMKPTERSAPRFERPTATPAEEAKPAASDWPDPLDFHGFSDDDAQSANDTPADVAPVADDVQPPTSPFLSDAKVEKRPLGAFSDTEGTVVESSSTESTDQTLPEPTAEAEVAPDASESIEAPLESPAEASEATPESPAVEEEPATVPAAITQQYKEQPATEDHPSGAIYDTESYHAPLTHAPHKRSGALVVVWILALIVIGGGVGAGVYYFVLPML